MSAPLAPPRFVSASTCLVDKDARGGSPASRRWKPLEQPAWSMSQAALVFTSPSPAGKRGASSGSAAATASGRMGLVKKDPALHVSWSSGFRTIPFPARSSSTVERTKDASARSPASTPRRRASSEYMTGALRDERSRRKSTLNTTQRPVGPHTRPGRPGWPMLCLIAEER